MSAGPDTPLGALGAALREGRTRKGWTAPQAAEETRIPLHYIKKLEDGDVSGIPAAVYARGFVRAYAKALGLDEAPLLTWLDEAGVRSATEPSAAEVIPAAAAAPAAPDPRRRATLVAAVVVGSVILGLGIRALVRWAGSGEPGEVPPSPFAAPAKPTSAGKPSPVPSHVAGGSAALAAVRVSVTAVQECWMQWQVDEGRPEDATLSPGEQRAWSGNARVRVLIGNASAARLSGPSGPVTLPTKPGRVAHLLFTPSGLERLPLPQAPAQSATAPY